MKVRVWSSEFGVQCGKVVVVGGLRVGGSEVGGIIRSASIKPPITNLK
jgi:hypothetical protein